MKRGAVVRIKRDKIGSFQPRAMARIGVIKRVRPDGLLVVKWTGVTCEQIFHVDLLETVPAQSDTVAK